MHLPSKGSWSPDPIFLGEPDPQGSEQSWIEGEGLGFADDDLLEVGMSGIEEVIGFSKDDDARKF